MQQPEPMQKDPNILGGIAVFAGTRVPLRTLFAYIEAGDPLDEFLNDFPSVTRDQAVALLEWCRRDAEQGAHARAA